MKILLVIDMQKDFITGSLANEDAQKIISNVVARVEEARNDENTRFAFTLDTHRTNYLETEEGKNLPIEHCITNTDGWNVIPELEESLVFAHSKLEKDTFGSKSLIYFLETIDGIYRAESVEIIGVCTDVCVIANAIIAKTALPNVPIYINASCCAGTTPESHDRAIEAMKALQMHILNEGEEPWKE